MAAPTAPVMGANGVLVLNSGTLATPTWSEMPNVRDVESALDFGDTEVTARSSGGFKQHEPTLADISFSTEHMYDPADAQLMELRTAALNRTAVDLAILDGNVDEIGSQGWRMRVKAFKMSRPEALDGIMSLSFDWKLCYSSMPPAYLVVA